MPPEGKKINADLCDEELCIHEIAESINSLKEKKSPGNDGLTGEFNKTFCDDLATFLLSIFQVSLDTREYN